jgi:hypothetical protein
LAKNKGRQNDRRNKRLELPRREVNDEPRLFSSNAEFQAVDDGVNVPVIKECLARVNGTE